MGMDPGATTANQRITLADFLLARIAEDEEVARAVVPVPRARRVLADCEAKRRIVARYEDCLARAEDPDYPAGLARDQIREYEDFVLPALALPYADHPDYRDEWDG